MPTAQELDAASLPTPFTLSMPYLVGGSGGHRYLSGPVIKN